MCVYEMIERANVASSPCWLWGMNIKDNHWVWFKPHYTVHHHVHVHGCSVITGFFFSLSLRLPVSQSVCCLCVDLFPSVLFCSSPSLYLLSLFSLFMLLCPFHPVLPTPFSYLAKSFICLKYKWFEHHNHSWLVGVDPVLRLMIVLWAISCSLFSLFQLDLFNYFFSTLTRGCETANGVVGVIMIKNVQQEEITLLDTHGRIDLS